MSVRFVIYSVHQGSHLKITEKGSKTNKCMTKSFCKEDHAHKVIVKKFGTRKEGLSFIDRTLTRSAPFKDVYTLKDETNLTCRCKMDCPAKITLKAVKRQDPQSTVEYVLQASVAHEPSQPPQVLLLVEQG